jgi:hypothetical protein
MFIAQIYKMNQQNGIEQGKKVPFIMGINL